MPTPAKPPTPRPAPPRPHDIPQPARPRRADLPHALTFFLTTAQRRAVLRALGSLHRSRESALLRALGLDPPPTDAPGAHARPDPA